MEAATAGQGPAAAEAGQAQAPEGEAPETQQQPEVEVNDWQQSIDGRLSEAADSVRQLADLVQSRLPEPEAEPGPDFEAQFSELFEQSGGFPDAQQLQSLVQQQAQSIAQEAVAPLQQQLSQFQQQMTAQELAGLQTEFPELATQAEADKLADAVVRQVSSLGLPREFAEGLMQNANFVRQVHLAEKANSRGQQETPAGQGQTIPPIEAGGGAAPSTGGGDEWDKIANAGRETRGPIW